MHAEGWDHYFERLESASRRPVMPERDEWAWAPEKLDPVVAADAVSGGRPADAAQPHDEDRTKPTPCTDFTCHDLAEHLFTSLAQLGHGGVTR